MVLNSTGLAGSRQREIFPLPIPSCSSPQDIPSTSLSKSQLRRMRTKFRKNSWLADGIQSLNELSGAPYSCASEFPRNAAHHDVLDRLHQLYSCVPKPDVAQSGARAFAELCKTASRYDPLAPAVLPGDRASYDKADVSWPPHATTPHPVVNSLTGRDKYVVENWSTHMLKSSAARTAYENSQNRIKPFLEPTLVHDVKVYADFLKEMENSGMLTWHRDVPSLLGVFFVKQSNGKLRIILDTRDVNNFFSTPPKTSLPTSAALSNVEVGPDDVVFFSGCDLQNAFYHMSVPAGMEKWFSLPSIPAGAIDGLADRLGVSAFDHVVPCLQVLPMGFSWSLHICQAVHESRLEVSGVSDSQRVQDRRPAPDLSDGITRVATYVDNHLCMGINAKSITKLEGIIREDLTDNNLPCHDFIDETNVCDFVGLHLDGARHETRVSWKRVWRLRLGIAHALSMPQLSGKEVEILVGHCTWIGLLRRESLSIFSSVYAFIKRFKKSRGVPWFSVRRELTQFSALLPLLVPEWDLEWSPQVVCTDSSEF